jgi:hypothetical protein
LLARFSLQSLPSVSVTAVPPMGVNLTVPAVLGSVSVASASYSLSKR